MVVVEKVLNSSVILSKVNGQDAIILDKGIGYGKKSGQMVELSADAKVFEPSRKKDLLQLEELLEKIDPSYLEAAQLIVEYAQAVLSEKLNDHIYLALTDHLSFAAQRQKEGLNVVNRLYWDMKTLYPREFKIGQYGLKIMKGICGVTLPEEEAANIAFHIMNAVNQNSIDNELAKKQMKLTKQILEITTYSLGINIQEDSLNYSRFVSHVQYFAARFFSNEMFAKNDKLYAHMSQSAPEALTIAEKIREFIEKQYSVFITDEETAYLTIHIERLRNRSLQQN